MSTIDTATVPLRAHDVTYSIAGQTILCKTNIALATGECVFLLGNNGAGKTTLLRCLSGALRVDAGMIQLFGQPVNSSPENRLRVGFVAHESQLYDCLTVRENLIFAARMSGIPRPRREANRRLDDFGLGEFASVLPPRLSRGMRRRAAIARALIHDPPLWLLDEPAAGLDGNSLDWLTRKIQCHCDRGGSCCIATHRPQAFALPEARYVYLDSGRLGDKADVSSYSTITWPDAA